MNQLKICVDLSKVFSDSLFGLYNAYRERETNVLNKAYRNIVGADMLTEQLIIDTGSQGDFNKFLSAKAEIKGKLNELALHRDKFWKNGKTIKVKFLGGDSFFHDNVKLYAKEWEKFANIGFIFVDQGDAEVRVAFEQGKGSWSYVGSDARNISDQNVPTMNFGWFNDHTTPAEFSRTIAHEFGHCLGCIHEHQSPSAGINWNKVKVYEFYKSQIPSWDEATVDKNIFEQFTSETVTNSEFDPKSIMLYPITAEHTTDGFSVGMNSVISAKDAEFIAKCYPKKPSSGRMLS